MKRRDALKLIAAGIVSSTTPQWLVNEVKAQSITLGDEQGELLNQLAVVPPSLMLHSREGAAKEKWSFSKLLDTLVAKGYAPTTYRRWREDVLSQRFNTKSILISIDDIAPQQNNAWPVFQLMQEQLEERGALATFAVNTNRHSPQDPYVWQEIASWTQKGFEIATHTDTHAVLTNQNGGSNQDLAAEGYVREITDSARFIEHMLYINSVTHPVRTLILPYGLGWNSHTNSLHPEIINACQQCNISMAVGIGYGRGAFVASNLSHSLGPIYLGRTGPFDTNSTELDTDVTVGLIDKWYENNIRVLEESDGSL